MGVRFPFLNFRVWMMVVSTGFGTTVYGELFAGQGSPAPRFPLVSTEVAWQLLPECEAGYGQPLPAWARTLVTSLPVTTAAMLEMDLAYRRGSELDAGLRARVRWTAADANRCELGRRLATADMRHAGMPDSVISTFVSGNLHAEESDIHQFVRRLTLHAWRITDEEFASLLASCGQRETMAIVLHTAYANFQDRLFLTLDQDAGTETVLDPVSVKFATIPHDHDIAALRPVHPVPVAAAPPKIEFPPGWGTDFSVAQLEDGLARQQVQPLRIDVPDWEMVRPLLKPEYYSVSKPLRIRWSLCVLGYQPELGMHWLRTMRIWYREAKADQVQLESAFWVVTRNLQCFY
jgi:alkylhydroperoxidase family enzyme